MAVAINKYTPDRVEKIIQALKAGNAPVVAARYGGVSLQAFKSWCEEFTEFREQVEEAEASFEIRNVAIIQQAAPKVWTAAAWLLERSHPERWGRVDRVEIYQVQRQAAAIAEELRLEGIEITEMELLKEREAMQKRLPAPTGQNS